MEFDINKKDFKEDWKTLKENAFNLFSITPNKKMEKV